DSRRPRQAGTSPAAEHPGFNMTGSIRRGDGFTLLEVLVAVVIMAVIMTTAFGALRLGGRSWEAGVTRATDNERFRAVAGLMRRQVSQIIPMTWPDGTKKRIAFEGASDRLRFVSPAPQQHRQAGLFEYGLSAQQDGPDTNLILSFIPFNPDAEAFQRPARDQQLLLVKGLQRVSFEYFGSPTNAAVRGRARTSTQPPSWYPRWSADAGNYPDLIRVTMEVNEGQQPWPELYLALPAGGSQ
ncbi:MAG: prepilin-type N-terminal cleavage/methylation domain-containing protein, partial [Thiogranum sp.]